MNDPQDLLATAAAMLASGRFDEAESIASALLTEDPENDPAATLMSLATTRLAGLHSRRQTLMQTRLAQIEGQRAIADLLAQPRYAQPLRLTRHGAKAFSQNDEDGIIAEIFRRIGPGPRTFVEFGVSDGRECNTLKLVLEGWSGLWMEMGDDETNFIRIAFYPWISSGRLRLRQARVTRATIDGLIAESGLAGEIDLLSIDVDGNDWWLWQAIVGVRPRVVVIEYNATLLPPLCVTSAYDDTRLWDGSCYGGASLAALETLGRRKGYALVGCCLAGVNAFFVREDLAVGRFHAPFTALEHFEPPRYWVGGALAGHPPGIGPWESV
ncbi:MAG: hypothetical protein HQL38_11525 [Alphaproteobacteria bacterium]|nr:hypothetical protein [Alphaproteobacteria bacterium]